MGLGREIIWMDLSLRDGTREWEYTKISPVAQLTSGNIQV